MKIDAKSIPVRANGSKQRLSFILVHEKKTSSKVNAILNSEFPREICQEYNIVLLYAFSYGTAFIFINH